MSSSGIYYLKRLQLTDPKINVEQKRLEFPLKFKQVICCNRSEKRKSF